MSFFTFGHIFSLFFQHKYQETIPADIFASSEQTDKEPKPQSPVPIDSAMLSEDSEQQPKETKQKKPRKPRMPKCSAAVAKAAKRSVSDEETLKSVLDRLTSIESLMQEHITAVSEKPRKKQAVSPKTNTEQ